VHRYNFDLPTTLRLRELIDEYGRMRRLEGMTPQQRGQRFNEFIAELLRCWGLDRVDANVRSVGEIDVTFAVNGTRFILEAKWEQGPVDYGPMAKLRGRITQRLAGTRGVLLSMSGYSDEALEGIVRGQQPDMLLLDRTHLEAMLSGLRSPADLFTELMDRASYCGEVQVPLTDLVVTKDRPMPPVLRLGGPDDSAPVITETAPCVHGDVVLHGTQPQETIADGIAVDPDGRLLLTMPQGVVRADPGTGACDVTLTCLGAEMGQEQRNVVDFQAGIWNAVWLSGRRFFLAGDGHFGVVDLDKTPTVPIDDRLRSPHPDQRGAIRIDEHTVMTATRHGTVYRIDVETGETTLIARLNMLALGCDMTSDDHGRAYILEHQGSPRAFIPIVVTLSGYAG
jgi:Holliday junction resolvase-like predicted endonuclease